MMGASKLGQGVVVVGGGTVHVVARKRWKKMGARIKGGGLRAVQMGL